MILFAPAARFFPVPRSDAGWLHAHVTSRLQRTILIFAGVLTLSALSQLAGLHISTCLLRSAFGIPCPGCGVTTSVMEILSGHLARAVEANAAGPAVAIFFALQMGLLFVVRAGVVSELVTFQILQVSQRALAAALLIAWCVRLIGHT